MLEDVLMVYMQKEWTSQEGKIPCLSIQQPYASAILWGKKSIELRTWRTSYRGVIAIHAGLSWVGGARIGKPIDEHEVRVMREAVQRLGTSTRMGDYPTGSIIGVARLIKCAPFESEESYERLYKQHKSNAQWSSRDIGWLFEDVRLLEEPIRNVRGQLGLFPVDVEPLRHLLREGEY